MSPYKICEIVVSNANYQHLSYIILHTIVGQLMSFLSLIVKLENYLSLDKVGKGIGEAMNFKS